MQLLAGAHINLTRQALFLFHECVRHKRECTPTNLAETLNKLQGNTQEESG